jgi:hypothetical protein
MVVMHFTSKLVASKIVASAMLVSCAVGVGGCDEAVTPLVDEPIDLRAKLQNGAQINGASLNGTSLNGVTLNGEDFNGVTLNGVTLNGVTLNGVTLNGTSFNGTRLINGVPTQVSGSDFIGAVFSLFVNGAPFAVTFNDIYLDPYNPGGDVYLYDISVYDVLNNMTVPMCTSGGTPVPAIPLINHWDPITGDRTDDATVVTFACRGGALAKCVDWGYRPWATGTRCDPITEVCSAVSLTDFHQACTRMVRADYCGDGTPHTVNGTLIDVYDRLSPTIQTQGTAENPMWGIEAEWGPDGALCAGDSLRLQHLDELEIPYTTPPCLEDLLEQEDCGTFPASRGAKVGNSYCGAFGSDPKSCG